MFTAETAVNWKFTKLKDKLIEISIGKYFSICNIRAYDFYRLYQISHFEMHPFQLKRSSSLVILYFLLHSISYFSHHHEKLIDIEDVINSRLLVFLYVVIEQICNPYMTFRKWNRSYILFYYLDSYSFPG